MVSVLIGSANGRFTASAIGPRRSVEIHAVKSSKFGFQLGFPRVASIGASSPRAPRALGMVAVSAARGGTAGTVPRTTFLLEVLVKARASVGMASLVSMESGSSPGALKMCLNGSLVELIEVFLLILGFVLGKMVTDRVLKNGL